VPSTCPKCHKVLDEDEICCAQIRYTWRCVSCFKLSTGSVVPYGRCFLCGGELKVIADRPLGDGMGFRAVREAVQFELDSFHFYRLARERATKPETFIVLESFYEAALEHLHELEEKYHACLDRAMVELASDEEKLLADWPFRGVRVDYDATIPELYRIALSVEQRAHDHFRVLESEFTGLESDLCRELAAESDEHVSLLETEMESAPI